MTKRKLIVFALAALILALAGGEAAVRLVFPDLSDQAATMQFANPHRDQPGSFDRDPVLFWKLKAPNPAWQVNQDGYRGPRRPVEKAPGTLRVVCLGDSCTFGLGTPPLDYAQTYPAVLEGLLAAALGRPVEVLNFGCPGYTSWQGRQLLRVKAMSYRPDFVTAYFGINDGFEAIGRGDAQQQPAPEISGRLVPVQQFVQHSSLYLLLTRGVTFARRQAAFTEGRPRVSFDEFRENARAMRDMGAGRGFQMLFIPAHFIDDAGGLSVEEISRVDPSIPLTAAFADSGLMPGELFYPEPDRVHPTAAGHRIIAEVLTKVLTSRVQGGGI